MVVRSCLRNHRFYKPDLFVQLPQSHYARLVVKIYHIDHSLKESIQRLSHSDSDLRPIIESGEGVRILSGARDVLGRVGKRHIRWLAPAYGYVYRSHLGNALSASLPQAMASSLTTISWPHEERRRRGDCEQ